MLSTVRFRIPKSAADALHLSAVKRRARMASVTDVRFDVDERRSSSGEVRVTCSIAMAIFLVGEMRAIAERAKAKRDTALDSACSQAVSSAFKAIDELDKASITKAADKSASA